MKSDAVAAAVSEALRLVNRSRAGWPEEAVEHAARRAAELAREEERERCAGVVEVGLHKVRKGFEKSHTAQCTECRILRWKAAAIRAGSGE